MITVERSVINAVLVDCCCWCCNVLFVSVGVSCLFAAFLLFCVVGFFLFFPNVSGSGGVCVGWSDLFVLEGVGGDAFVIVSIVGAGELDALGFAGVCDVGSSTSVFGSADNVVAAAAFLLEFLSPRNKASGSTKKTN